MRFLFVVTSSCLLIGCEQVTSVSDRLLTSPEPEETTPVGGPLAAPLSEEAVPDTTLALPSEPVPTSGVSTTTIVSLGDPARQGSWLETPLVTSEQAGQVRWADKGVNVTLIPVEGEPTAGSRMSLEAMQALGLPLTDLTEVQVLF